MDKIFAEDFEVVYKMIHDTEKWITKRADVHTMSFDIKYLKAARGLISEFEVFLKTNK